MRRLPLFMARPFGAVVLGVLLFASAGAQAQAGGAQATIMQLNQQAMTAYGNLQFPEAMQLLQQAEAMCNQYNIRGSALARTYVNMGMVEFGGSGNNAGALEHFKKAVCLDPSVMLDPLNSTPDVEMLFKGAQSQAQAPGACGGLQPQPAYPQPQPQPTYPQPQPQPGYPPQPQPGSMQLVQHTQVTQQVRLTPVPIFVQVNPNVQVGSVVLFYRTIGESIFQQIPMNQHGNGFAATIGCDVLRSMDPIGIEYYIAVLDTSNRLLGTSGSEAQPHQTSIVQTLTVPPPALPNEMPPAACREECPPWNPDCDGPCKQFGDLCDSDSDCCSGMSCVNETCTQSDGEDGPSGPFTSHFRMPISFGTGAGLVTGGTEEPYNQVSSGKLSVGTGFAWSKFHIRANPMIYIPAVEGLAIGVSFRGGLPLEPNWKKYNMTPLAPSIMAAVSYQLAGKGDPKGFELHFMGGLGYSVMYNRVAYKDCKSIEASQDGTTDDDIDYEEGDIVCVDGTVDSDWDDDIVDSDGWTGKEAVTQTYFKKAGPFGIELGLDAYFWFVPQFGLNFGLMTDILMPDFVWNFDINLGLAVRF